MARKSWFHWDWSAGGLVSPSRVGWSAFSRSTGGTPRPGMGVPPLLVGGDAPRRVPRGAVAAVADRVDRAVGARVEIAHQDALIEGAGEVTGPVVAPAAVPRPAVSRLAGGADCG